MAAVVFLGVGDWRRPDWVGPFYPEDMPEDWRWAYFNNQFSCVWLPFRDWSAITAASAEAMARDTRPGFRFLFETGAAESEHEAELLAIFGPWLGLHCQAGHPDLIWFDAAVDPRDLARRLGQRRQEGATTYLLSRDGDLATLNKVADLLDLLGVGAGGEVG
jgi:hypothetical protein